VDKESGKSTIIPPLKLSEIILTLAHMVEWVSVKYVPIKELIDFAKE